MLSDKEREAWGRLQTELGLHFVRDGGNEEGVRAALRRVPQHMQEGVQKTLDLVSAELEEALVYKTELLGQMERWLGASTKMAKEAGKTLEDGVREIILPKIDHLRKLRGQFRAVSYEGRTTPNPEMPAEAKAPEPVEP